MTPYVLIAAPDAERVGVAEFLRREGVKAATVADADGCLESIRREAPDVLVLDDELRPDGAATVLDRIDGDPGMPWVPSVLVLGEDPPEELEARLGLPPRCCLRKPVSGRELVDRIRGLAGRRDALGDARSRSGSVAACGSSSGRNAASSGFARNAS